jgi:hypothetical protein
MGTKEECQKAVDLPNKFINGAEIVIKHAAQSKSESKEFNCHACGQPGHRSRDCPSSAVKQTETMIRIGNVDDSVNDNMILDLLKDCGMIHHKKIINSYYTIDTSIHIILLIHHDIL